MRKWTVVLTLVFALGCGGMFLNKWKLVSRDLKGGGTALAPRGLEAGRRIDTTHGVAYHFNKIHSWSMGSGTPYQTRFVVQLLAPDLSPDQVRAQAFSGTEALDQCDEVRWLDKETGECRHRVNTIDEPSWILRALDEQKKAAVEFRVWKKDLDRAKAAAMVKESLASVRTTPDLAATIAEIRDLPRREAEATVRRIAEFPDWWAKRGFPKPVPGQVMEHDGFVYYLDPGELKDFTIGRFLGELHPKRPPLNESIPGAFGADGMKLRQEIPLHWFVHQDGEWKQHDFHVHWPAPPPVVARIEARHKDPSAVYIYSFQQIRLQTTEFVEAVWEKYLRLAKEAERQFAAGTLFTPGE